MEWLYLALAIVFEIAGTTCVKLSQGFARLTPSLFILPLYVVSFILLTLAVKVIPISLAYAIWAGVGTAIIAVIGFFIFDEPISMTKVACIGLILVGIFGLHFSEHLSKAA